MEKYCLNCGKKIVKINTFCNKECNVEYKKNKYIEKWENGEIDGSTGIDKEISITIKKHLKEKRGEKCEICGWKEVNKHTGKIPLEFHHKDGVHTNNKEENLQILCPNCHSLTETHKGANTSSRKLRRNKIERDKEIKRKEQEKKENENKEVKAKREETKNPGKEVLMEKIKHFSILKISRDFGVSDNAVRKWLIKEKLPSKKSEIDNFFGRPKKMQKKSTLLTADQVKAIRENKNKKTQKELAKEFNTNRFTIGRIQNNKRYKKI